MRILIIDSHKGTNAGIPQNLHWKNSKILAEYLNADLLWSFPSCNDIIHRDYDIIIFVHASHYAYTDYKWLEFSPNAKLFYITNEYNLGEPRTLWMAAKAGRKYTVIANHPHQISKVVMKYVDEWNIVNINSLIFGMNKQQGGLTSFLEDPHTSASGCIYYGSFRKDRSKYFNKYLDENIIVSTHSKNENKFREAGVTSVIQKRIDWNNTGLFQFKYSLYIEDEITHTNYNHLANRFYEALNYGCIPIFSEESRQTVEQSGYEVSEQYFITNSSELKNKTDLILEPSWLIDAAKERTETLDRIKEIIYASI